MLPNRFSAALILLLTLLSGCSTTSLTPELTSQQTWREHNATLSHLHHWQLLGKIALITADERHSASLFWEQNGDDYQMQINNLFGTPIIEMKKTGGIYWLRVKQEEEYQGVDPELLVFRLTGWQLPLLQMPNWLIGDPADSPYTLNALEVVDTITATSTEPNWQISYKKYGNVDSVALPTQIEMKSETNRIKLAINEWNLQKTANE